MDRIYSGILKNRFLFVETSSYLSRNLISLFPSQQIAVVMIDSIEKREYYVFFVGVFLEQNCRIFLRFLMKVIQSIRIEVKEGIYARHVLYMEIRGQWTVPLTHTDENLTSREIEQKAVELAYFLRVPIEVF
ncbi:hypothetical protein PVK06_046509 [Gossypium arboreum]|uniref:Photosystem I assembly protein Ycf4 n=1 Tax=Gossypium arboreum TaxID=29729 RepID=A0ABR0MDC7_GOSAR|nr:hypothetical protein PVK06_046509 [Gossypium arboreum]